MNKKWKFRVTLWLAKIVTTNVYPQERMTVRLSYSHRLSSLTNSIANIEARAKKAPGKTVADRGEKEREPRETRHLPLQNVTVNVCEERAGRGKGVWTRKKRRRGQGIAKRKYNSLIYKCVCVCIYTRTYRYTANFSQRILAKERTHKIYPKKYWC